MMIRLLLVDDLIAVRRGLKMRLELEVDMLIVGEAATGREVHDLVQTLQPDVVLMDVELPDMSGIEVTGMVRTSFPRSNVVMLSLHGDAETRARAMNAGAVLFVEKHEPMDNLLAAIRKAAELSRCA